MKKSLPTADHHQVTCWNENPFFPHFGADEGYFVWDIPGSETWEGKNAGAPHTVGSIQHCMQSITIFVPQKWGRAHKSTFEGRCGVFWDHRPDGLWKSQVHRRLAPSPPPTEKQLQTNWRARKRCTHLYEDPGRASSKDSQMDLDSSGYGFWADDRKLNSTDHLTKTVNLS